MTDIDPAAIILPPTRSVEIALVCEAPDTEPSGSH